MKAKTKTQIKKALKFKLMNKEKIIAKDKDHLKFLILNENYLSGMECDLNHIDISNVKEISLLFQNSQFNGNISDWNVSNVESMLSMFFNSEFNEDISRWDVSNVKSMSLLFSSSKFNKNLSSWKPLNLIKNNEIFKDSKIEKEGNTPYWAEVDIAFLPQAIKAYHLNKKITHQLPNKNDLKKKLFPQLKHEEIFTNN